MTTQRELVLKSKVGDKVDVYVTGRKRSTNIDTSFTVFGTIISRYNSSGNRLIGWKSDEEKPINTVSINCYVVGNEIIINYKEYTNVLMWEGRVEEVRVATLYPKFDGENCCKCKEPYYMAAPNQKDGTFICSLCVFNPYRNWKVIE